MRTTVDIIAMGARTPVGVQAATAAAAARAGISRLREHPTMVDRAGEPLVLACDPWLPPNVSREERLTVMATHALRQVVLVDERPIAPRARLPVLLALPELDETLDDAAVQRVCWAVVRQLEDVQPIHVVPVPAGHAAGAYSLGQAIATLLAPSGPAAIAVVGVDSYIDADVLDALERDERLRRPGGRFGFPPGEAAGALLLTASSPGTSMDRRLATIVAAEHDHEPQAQSLPDPVCTGEGLARAWKKALRSIRYPQEVIAHTYTDSNGERYRDRELTYAMLRVPAHAFASVESFTTAVDCWGDVGAATVPLHAILAVSPAQRGYSPGEHVLLSSGSFSGLRGAVVLRLPIHPRGLR